MKEKKSFKCDICDYSCSFKPNLNIHIESVYEGKKPFQCDICNHCCFHKMDLKRHTESVHEETKPFKCGSVTTVSLWRLTWNDTVHEKKKPFKCEICDYNCSLKHDMKVHTKSVHEGKKPFQSAICDYKLELGRRGKKIMNLSKLIKNFELDNNSIFHCAYRYFYGKIPNYLRNLCLHNHKAISFKKEMSVCKDSNSIMMDPI